MKELAEYFNRRYSSVSAQEESNAVSVEKRRKSLNPNRPLNQGFNIVDTFFSERSEGKRTRVPKCAFLLLAGGLLAIATAILVKIFGPYDLIFKWKLVFEEGGEIFGLWEKPPVDLYLKVYLFNITNAEAFLAGKEKMNVEEVGPYVYKELMTHENVTFNSNGTVSTIPRHPLVWQQDLSGDRREDDVVVMLNIAMLSIAQVVSPKGFFARLPVNIVLSDKQNQPIAKMTAKEFMFGYPSSITTLGNKLFPGWVYFNKVGLIDRMYDFDTDYETFYDGTENPSLSGLYATYRGSPNLPQWDGEHCSNINLASDGTKFKSFIQPNETVRFFRKSMCRPQNLIRVGEEIVLNNLAGYKYVFEDTALDNGEFEEKNKCYCRNGYCQPRGLQDVTDCYYGFPISLSYPHFMDADPGLLNNVTGLRPDRSQHSSYFIIQPDSGLPLTISVKIQINMHMRDVNKMNKVDRFSYQTFPMLWFEITMKELPSALTNRFNFYLNYLPLIDYIGFWGGLTLGIVFLMFAITRATVNLSHFTSISEKGKTYGKSNLRSGVYNPCEIKLIECNEKEKLTKQVYIEAEKGAMLYNVEAKPPVVGEFMLEDETALSDVDADECSSNGSDTLSQHSSSAVEDDYITDETETSRRLPADDENMMTISFGSSGFESTDINEDQDNLPVSDSVLTIGHISTEDFPPLRIIEEGEEEHSRFSHKPGSNKPCS